MSERSNVLTFTAVAISLFEEDGVLTVAFGDSESPAPDNYLILQREIPRAQLGSADDYYFELNDRSMSGEGGFERAYFQDDDFIIDFAQDAAKRYGLASVRIRHARSGRDPQALRAALHAVLDDTGCAFDDLDAADIAMPANTKPA